MNKFIEWFKKNVFEVYYSDSSEIYFDESLMILTKNIYGSGGGIDIINPNKPFCSFKDCYAIRLFTVFIDFRNWFIMDLDDRNNPQWFLDSEIRSMNEDIEKKNKKRKNKIPVPTFSKIPWYVSIINWKSLYFRTRKFVYFIVGFILGGIIF